MMITMDKTEETRRNTHDYNIQKFKEVGENRRIFPVEAVVVGAIVIDLMLSGIPQAVAEKESIVCHGQNRHDQTPDPVAKVIGVELGAGGKTAAEVRCKPDKCNSHDKGSRRSFFI